MGRQQADAVAQRLSGRAQSGPERGGSVAALLWKKENKDHARSRAQRAVYVLVLRRYVAMLY
jgi:hypothetical protein